jgi:hypothetical protein
MPDTRKEQDNAWRLWHLLNELNSLLWERYESEFIERHLAEEDRRLSIESDAPESESLPF